MNKNDFYRYCRLVHGWLSAFAFIALCFFSFTGLVLNHPEWVSGSPASIVKQKVKLSEAEIQELRDTKERSPVLVQFAAKRMALEGELAADEAEGNAVGDEVFVRLRGVRGVSYLRADLRSGAFEITVEEASTFSMLNELHRAERAGKSWRLVVDVIAVVLIAMSLIGYVIFLSMRGARLRTAILLTFGSTLGLCLLLFYAVS